MTRARLVRTIAALTLSTLFTSTVSAQDAQPVERQDAQPVEEEDARLLQLAEPDYRVITLPTTMLLPRNGWSFDLTHRFAGNLANRSFADNLRSLFGIDDGATVGIEFRYAFVPRVQTAVFRTTFDRTIQIHGKYDAVRQSGPSPVSVSALLSVEGIDNFTEHYAPAAGVVVSRTVSDVFAMYVAPIVVHNSAARIGDTRTTFQLGLGTRLRLRPTVYVVGEVNPRLAGYQPGHPAFGFAIEKRAGGHMFQLNFTNTSSTTYAQVARGGFPESLHLGFNLARKFF
jgi:hypothetical protein